MLYIDNLGGIGLELSLLIKQSVPAELTALNSRDLPDIYYLGQDGASYGIEIKQAGEICGSLSSVEEQLAREYRQVDQLSLCITGIITPTEGGCQILKWSRDGRTGYCSGMAGGRPYHQDYSGYRAWLEGVRSWGIEVVELPNKLALAQHLVATYRYHQKPPEDHHTFQAAIRPHRQMIAASPMVLSLMGICDAQTGRTFTGEAIASALEKAYGTLKGLVIAPAKEIAEIKLESGRRVGSAWVEKFERAIGNADW